MKFILQPDQLKTAFSALKTVAARNNALPVLDNILFRPAPDGQHFLLTCSDGDKSVTVPISIDEPADLQAFLFPFSTLGDYISAALGQWPVEVEVSSMGELTITDLMGDFHCLVNTNVDEFPSMPPITDAVAYEVPAAVFCAACSVAAGFVGDDTLRPMLGGVCLDFGESQLRVVASDTKKLFCESIPGVAVREGGKKIIVPAKMASRLSSVFATGSDDTIQVLHNARSVCFIQGEKVLQGTLIEGNYPRYGAVIPKNNTIIVALSRSQFLAAIKRVSIASSSVTGLIGLNFDGQQQLVFSASDIDYSVSSSVKMTTVSQKGGSLLIGVRTEFVREAVSVMDADVVNFFMSDPTHPIIIRPQDDIPHRLVLVMPMMLE